MDDQAELERLERALVESLRAGDRDALVGIWDDEFVFTDPDGRSLTRDECLAKLDRGEIRLSEASIASMQVRVFGDTGVVLGIMSLRGWAGNFVFDGDYSFMDVYRKLDDHWRAVLSSGDRATPLVR
jgi:ketosteroid isomerase-like protein